MKLAEALQERADLNKKIDELRRRLNNCILVQEGEDPIEDPEQLLEELDRAIDRLGKRITQINRTNCRTEVNGMSLTAMIAKKDMLLVQLSAYRDLVYAAGQGADRARGTEIKIKAVLKIRDIQSKVDRMAKEVRELDNLLQETNWKTELLEA